jgi:signal transduction histidine kinase
MAGIRHFVRSAGVRLALGYAGLFGLSALILVLVLWSTTLQLLNGQVDAAIKADALGLAERWQDGGPDALLTTIEERLAGNVDDDAIYLVINDQGRPVVGNLSAWPAAVSEAGPIYELRVKRHGTESLARLHRYELPGGYSLLVGRNVQPRAALRDLLTHTLAWALLLIGFLSIAGGIIVQRLFRRMLSHVSATAAAISAGDLSPRVRLSGRGDEFDRLAETINDMLDRISRLMDGVREVSNAIAHDLRTPITRARARLEDAAEHATDANDLQGAIQRAIADLDGITAVFQALLRISEIEAGARRSAFTLIDLAPLLEDLTELYGAVAEERDIKLVLHAASPLLTRGDRELIQQAVANLLDNALKFSPPGSTVRLTAMRDGGVLHLSVTDEGAGIPDDDVERATERFFRGESARSTPGFGLGLTLVRAVAQLHGGNVQLLQANPGLKAVLTLQSGGETEREEMSVRRATLSPPGQHQHVTVRRLGRI